MSVQPIDVQVLLARLNQIGREQAVHRDALVQSQAVAADEIARKSAEQGHGVVEVSTEEEGPETVGDGSAGGSGGKHGPQREHDKPNSGDEPFRDPELGQNVDVTG